MHFGHFRSVDRFEPAKRLKCLQNCGIIKTREAVSPQSTQQRRLQNENNHKNKKRKKAVMLDNHHFPVLFLTTNQRMPATKKIMCSDFCLQCQLYYYERFSPKKTKDFPRVPTKTDAVATSHATGQKPPAVTTHIFEVSFFYSFSQKKHSFFFLPKKFHYLCVQIK